jgi:indole-3-glycerol phosphate synthase
LKAASPSAGIIRENLEPERIAEAFARGGAVGISVLTEPKHFNGSLAILSRARKVTNLPILMKDIITSPRQLETASKIGADAALLIQALFDRKQCELGVTEMIAEAHDEKLEVLLETHSQKEFHTALGTDADLIGINNRDLATLKVDLNVTKNILDKNVCGDKLVVTESGIESAFDIRFLSGCGANAFLVGSALMRAEDIEHKTRELVEAL